MILAIDIGNSHIVLGCIEGDNIVRTARMATNSLRTEYEYAVTMKQIFEFEGLDCSDFEGAIISSVVPPLTATVHEAVKYFTGIDAILVGAGMKTGLNIQGDSASQVGSDLVAAGVAAVAAYKTPVIIIDMGTATTIMVIDDRLCLLGGAIVPGLRLSMDALANRTSQLPRVPVEAPRRAIGGSTIECMKSGAVLGTASMLDGMIDRMEEELGTKASVVATGGLAVDIIPYCKHSDIELVDDLVLRGLAIIYNKNRK